MKLEEMLTADFRGTGHKGNKFQFQIEFYKILI